MLTKQSNNGEILECARYKRKNQITEKSQSARDTNETIKLKKKFKCARDTNETIKLKRNLSVREILTKQLNKREI